MAKRSVSNRNNQRELEVKRAKDKREILLTERKQLIEVSSSGDVAAFKKLRDVIDSLDTMKKDSSPTRLRNRCYTCGRGKGVYKRFRMCRICIRKSFNNGYLPGLKKASW